MEKKVTNSAHLCYTVYWWIISFRNIQKSEDVYLAKITKQTRSNILNALVIFLTIGIVIYLGAANGDIGDAWVLPLPAAESKPFAFAEHSRRCRAPEFSPGAKLEITAIMSKNRGGKSPDGKETIAPALKSAFTVKAPAVSPVANARLFSMEFTMETPDSKKQTKRIIAKGFNLPERHSGAESPQLCIFSGKYPPGAELRFTATPVNCFGTRGKPLTATFKT